MSQPRPTHRQSDLAEMIEMLLDKGIVINADIVVSVGETELLGVHIRAAIASFETAATYGLEFPEGTDMERVEAAAEQAGGREIEDGTTQRQLTEELALGPPGGWSSTDDEEQEDNETADEEDDEQKATAEAPTTEDDGGE